MHASRIPFEERLLAHSESPLAISDSQRLLDPDGSWAEAQELDAQQASAAAARDLSPQRQWQLDRLARGVCQECGQEKREVRTFTTGTRMLTLGARCRERQNAARRILTAKQRSGEGNGH